MNKLYASAAASALMALASGAHGAGLERWDQSVEILFEEGTYVEFGFAITDPDVSGQLGPLSSGDMAESFSNWGVRFKTDLNDKLALAVMADQPIGANVDYPLSAFPYPFAGSTAEVNGVTLTAALKYQFDERWSAIGGLRLQQLDGSVAIPVFGNYALEVDDSYELGGVVGIAYEIPDIALRVALTYHSEFEHSFSGTETITDPLTGITATLPSTFETTIPQAVNLEWQTGIAANTLLFGKVRWVEWSVFEIAPPVFGQPLAFIRDDYITYTLGVGYRFNENWAAAIEAGYEPQANSPQGNLGPTDGGNFISAGATYTQGNTDFTFGALYTDVGDAITTTIGSDFAGNDSWSLGFRIGQRF
ncbi:MAG: outer membrane protein transport protein [Pseudomonadota bacterium]